MSLKDALTLKNKEVAIDGTSITLRRPSVADLADATMESKHGTFTAWLVFRHLLGENGKPYFDSVAEVMQCDAVFVEAIAVECDKLYGEGRDSTAQP